MTTNRRAEEILAVPMGVGVGLTFDEAALLLDLRDVYWTREGILSVQLSFGIAAILAGTILALRMLRRGEQHVDFSTEPDVAGIGRAGDGSLGCQASQSCCPGGGGAGGEGFAAAACPSGGGAGGEGVAAAGGDEEMPAGLTKVRRW